MTDKPTPRSARLQALRALWALARQARLDGARVRELAAETLGRPMPEGFGLSTCDAQELGRVIEALKRAAGMPVPQFQPTAREPPRRGRLPLRADGEPRASLEQYRLMRSLQEALHLSAEEFAGVARRATGKPHSVASGDISKIIEALKAIRRRRAADPAGSKRGPGNQAAG